MQASLMYYPEIYRVVYLNIDNATLEISAITSERIDFITKYCMIPRNQLR